MRCGLIAGALVALLAAGPAWARKGDIVPLPGKGVQCVARDGRKHSHTRLGPLEIEFEVSTGGGFLYVDSHVTNVSGAEYELGRGALSVAAKGDELEPLDPDQYIELAHQVKPLEMDKNGKIIEQKGKMPVKVFTPGAQVPGTTSGASLAEQMASDQWEEGSYEQRLHITKELQGMKKDLVRYGGTLKAGKAAKGRLVFQRNQLELPLDVRLVVGSKKLTVRFVREK